MMPIMNNFCMWFFQLTFISLCVFAFFFFLAFCHKKRVERDVCVTKVTKVRLANKETNKGPHQLTQSGKAGKNRKEKQAFMW